MWLINLCGFGVFDVFRWSCCSLVSNYRAWDTIHGLDFFCKLIHDQFGWISMSCSFSQALSYLIGWVYRWVRWAIRRIGGSTLYLHQFHRSLVLHLLLYRWPSMIILNLLCLYKGYKTWILLACCLHYRKKLVIPCDAGSLGSWIHLSIRSHCPRVRFLYQPCLGGPLCNQWIATELMQLVPVLHLKLGQRLSVPVTVQWAGLVSNVQ